MELVLGQLPKVVYDKVYTPTWLVDKVMVPVDGFNVKPGGTAEKVPPGKPVIVGL